MCFKRKSTRLLVSRSFRSLSGNYFININKHKEDRVLVIDLKVNDGSIDIKLTNLMTNNEVIKEAVNTGIYKFDIESNIKYRLILSSKKASGAYSVCLMPKL